MGVEELIKLDSRKVRGNSSLMTIYIDAFQKQFGRKPNCAGCTFGTDFANLIRAVKGGENPTVQKQFKSNKMENTFKLNKIQSRILFYRKDGKTFRAYDSQIKEDFAVAYLTNGSEEELKERRKMFAILPEAVRSGKEAKVSEPIAHEVPVAGDPKEETKVVDQTEEETVVLHTPTPIVKKTRKSRKNK